MLDVPMARQNTAVPASVQSRASEDTGEGSSSAPCGYAARSAIAASCQTISQKMIAQTRIGCLSLRIAFSPSLEKWRRDSAHRRKNLREIEAVIRHFAADSGRRRIVEHL